MNMLDLDEMKQTWAEHEKKLDESIQLNRTLLTALKLDRARPAVQRMTTALALESAIWLLCVAALGGFVFAHAGTLHLALAGVAVDVFAIGMLAVTIRQLVAARRIDYGGPVAAIQKEIEELRVLRIRTTQWGLLCGAVVWAPFLMVALKAVWEVDFYNASWLFANVLFGLLMIPLALWLSKRFGDRMSSMPFLQRLMRDLAGHNLTRAADYLATVSEFVGGEPNWR